MSIAATTIRLGFVPANRSFFSQTLAAAMRKETIGVMEAAGIEVVVPNEQQTRLGCVENLQEAQVTADLFRAKNVQGIVIGAVNFGDEQAAAWVIRQAHLDVPILIFGCQEEEALTLKTARRDSFCGLLSIGDALRQIGARYSVGSRPICYPRDASFAQDIDWFVRVCRVVNGIRNARYGQIGARPEPFWTCRFDERALQRLGPTTAVLDLSEALGGATAIPDTDPEIQSTIKSIQGYADSSIMEKQSLLKIAKFELFMRRWGKQHMLNAYAVQCWTSLQHHYGICACTAMSRLGDEGTPAACEADILGAMSMHAAQLASGSPAGLADWNNLHNDDDELVNVWHCGVFPKSFAKAQPRLAVHSVLVSSGATKAADSQGVVELVVKASPLTLFRVTQDEGSFKALIAQGNIEDNAAETAGAYGWCRIPDLQRLYRDVLLRHFPHHVAITQAHVGNALWEAFGNYLGIKVYHATQESPGAYVPMRPFA